ncbi:hypothetical protein CEUSTIGMA_g8883.t1 [Chlamydomonas eustigma]|uniref:HP domain-containing protein n=1 Tax=Chlamydomonas eustigma TaxID=1157962 RepID=A0A250XEE2_9CHLO|nr:hypothetical protein CEUSTIGMA_g8883.t1 [Chlamydomonas eustigma]|eukprot:GAX81454.1 hypothetical protein CEUSTIGMA_g8883.t1 [Chlamydomonas eustigma]
MITSICVLNLDVLFPPLQISKFSASPVLKALSSHDKQNTPNASMLLKLGAFRLQPLVDTIPYEELVKLRLEDGIDPTRKEDYLTDEEFLKVFSVEREKFKKLPDWKRQLKKKEVSLF